jgi:large conductance mechanosensitive channel
MTPRPVPPPSAFTSARHPAAMPLRMKMIINVLKEFQTFIMRGNVIQLAVAFVMGAAFQKLVEAAIATLIQPLLSKVVGGGGGNAGWLNFEYFHFGHFLTAVITFVATAAAVFFLIVKPLNFFFGEKKKEEPGTPPAPPATLEDVVAELKALRAEIGRGGTAPVALEKPILRATAQPPPPPAPQA